MVCIHKTSPAGVVSVPRPEQNVALQPSRRRHPFDFSRERLLSQITLTMLALLCYFGSFGLDNLALCAMEL